MTIFRNMVEYFHRLWYAMFRIWKIRGGKNMSSIKDNLETMAKDILIDNDMLKLPVNLSIIARNNDIDVYVSKLPKGISGAIKYNEVKNKFEILVQESDSYLRQRFTVAHELAHFFLEKSKLEKSKVVHFDILYRKGKNPEEKEVDYLAGAILMNQSMLERLYQVNQSISLLAKTFGVSESALTVRLMVLGLI